MFSNCSHLGGFLLFLWLAVGEEAEKAAVAGAKAAPGIVTFVLASANASWEATTSTNSVSTGNLQTTTTVSSFVCFSTLAAPDGNFEKTLCICNPVLLQRRIIIFAD